MLTSETTKAILSKMWEIMKDVDYIQKDKSNDFQHYRYASEAAIKDKCHEAFVKHKVIFSLESAPHKTEVLTGTKTRILEEVLTTWRFSDVDTGEFIQGTGLGSGIDEGDKGVYKAITGALKYILTGNLMIPTGDDPEDAKEATALPKTYARAPSYVARPKAPLPPLTQKVSSFPDGVPFPN